MALKWNECSVTNVASSIIHLPITYQTSLIIYNVSLPTLHVHQFIVIETWILIISKTNILTINQLATLQYWYCKKQSHSRVFLYNKKSPNYYYTNLLSDCSLKFASISAFSLHLLYHFHNFMFRFVIRTLFLHDMHLW